jgi:cytochrome c oxidase assembly protein subunit 15
LQDGAGMSQTEVAVGRPKLEIKGSAAPKKNLGDIFALAVGTTTAMWATAYLCRVPGTLVPSPVILVLMLLILIGGGFVGGWRTARGARAGLISGLITGLLNLMILGSLGHDLSNDQRIIQYYSISLPLSVIICGTLGFAGAWIGSFLNPDRLQRIYPAGAFPLVTTLATLWLIMAGGMVTGMNAGLSVPDWPDTFHYGMFLFPLAHMTGGVFFEHTHRLFGCLVGLVTLIQCVYVWRHEQRRWVRWLSFTALVMVIIQGMMGGLRVTGHFTLATARHDMDPSSTLAIVHGIFGQMFFAVLVALTAVCSRSWQSGLVKHPRHSANTAIIAAWSLVGLLLVQLTLGSILRHEGKILAIHIMGAIFVLVLSVFCGARAWGANPDQPILQRIGIAMLVMVFLQVMLGVSAVIALSGQGPLKHPDMAQAIITTAHQVGGAVLLAIATLLAVWTMRLEEPITVPAM